MDACQGLRHFCPVGPVVADGLDPWSGIQVERASTAKAASRQHQDFIFSLGVVVRYISQIIIPL